MLKKTPGGLLVPDVDLLVGGRFICQLVRKGEVIDEWESLNLIVNQGLDHILATEFTGGQQLTNWYVAPFGNNYVPQASDTATSIVGNAGEITAYTGSRPSYTGVEGSQTVTNAASPASFTFTSGVNVYGAFLISSQAQQATTGVLFAASQFPTAKPASTGDQLLVTYSVAASST